MTDFNQLLQQGGAHAWLYIPVAILLGALHGLEPGHSKTMMAAFIVAVRGTIAQAALLGICAALSHSLVIWLLAAVALHYGGQWNAEQAEPYFQLVSAALIAGLAVWMLVRTRRDLAASHTHAHAAGVVIHTGHSQVAISIFETNTPPVFRLEFAGQPVPEAEAVTVETTRLDGAMQTFRFAAKGRLLESLDPIPEPHEFEAVLTLGHDGHTHTFRTAFREHAHAHGASGAEFEDAHEREHAQQILQRFAGRTVTTPQLVLFGLTGGLLPCPAALTVLLVCLQLKQVTLGFALVAAFSVGLALTMVLTGALAAWSVRHAERKFRGFGNLVRRAPYVSCVLLLALAAYVAYQGWMGLQGAHP